MSATEATAFVAQHGIVLEASRHGAIPSLVDAVAGEKLHGSLWSHPSSRAIFAATRAVRASPDVLTCRLVAGKISFVHARLWPALARLAERFAPERLASLSEMHMQSGAHRIEEIAFVDWLTPKTMAAAKCLSAAEASSALCMLPGIELSDSGNRP